VLLSCVLLLPRLLSLRHLDLPLTQMGTRSYHSSRSVSYARYGRYDRCDRYHAVSDLRCELKYGFKDLNAALDKQTTDIGTKFDKLEAKIDKKCESYTSLRWTSIAIGCAIACAVSGAMALGALVGDEIFEVVKKR
jgi:hypothetical protein